MFATHFAKLKAEQDAKRKIEEQTDKEVEMFAKNFARLKTEQDGRRKLDQKTEKEANNEDDQKVIK
jgi:hypothetical protein